MTSPSFFVKSRIWLLTAARDPGQLLLLLWIAGGFYFDGILDQKRKACYILSMASKETFLKTYANLPQGSREEIIAVVRDEPYTWKSARLEVEQETPIGQEILDILTKLGIIA